MPKAHGHYSTWGGKSDTQYILTDKDISDLHHVLLEMYKEINAVCKQHGICVIAAGGTALGAVRHHGFIPWDDDMDLFMFREDFVKLSNIFESELGNDFYLLFPGSKNGANCFLPRIIKKNTTLLGMIDESSPYPQGIYIDINIIEFAPKNKLSFYRKAFGSDIRRMISYSVYWNQYKSKSLREFMLNSSGENYYKFRIIVGKIFNYRKAEKWFASFDKYVQGKKSDVYTVPSGSKKYKGERLCADTVFPLKAFQFEDTEIYVFNDYDKYLRNLYGDYMTIPKAEDRGQHLCLKFSVTEETRIDNNAGGGYIIK